MTKSETLVRELRETADWLWLRRAVGVALASAHESETARDILSALWPPDTVPRQVEVAHLQHRLHAAQRQIESLLRTVAT